MIAKEYLVVIEPHQQVMVVVTEADGSRTILADHEAGYLAYTSTSAWRDLEIKMMVERKNDILVILKNPAFEK
jgi:hypothetical protein